MILLELILYLLFYTPVFCTPIKHKTEPLNSNIYYYASHFSKGNHLKIDKHVGSNMADSGGADLFMVHTHDQNFVIKLDKPNSVKKEARALIELKDLEIAPKLLGQAEFIDDNKTVGVLVESYVDGGSLHSFLQKFANSKTPFSYWIHKHRLHKALKSFAQKLKHFHTLKSKPIHNDLHPGNIFYNSDQDKSTLIDLEHANFNKQRKEEDISYFLLTFEMYASKFNLKEKTVKSLQKGFLDNYALELDPKLMDQYRKLQIQEFKLHLDQDGCDEEKLLLGYINQLDR